MMNNFSVTTQQQQQQPPKFNRHTHTMFHECDIYVIEKYIYIDQYQDESLISSG